MVVPNYGPCGTDIAYGGTEIGYGSNAAVVRWYVPFRLGGTQLGCSGTKIGYGSTKMGYSGTKLGCIGTKMWRSGTKMGCSRGTKQGHAGPRAHAD
eukprot:3616505-Rhodomonas_salina.4